MVETMSRCSVRDLIASDAEMQFSLSDLRDVENEGSDDSDDDDFVPEESNDSDDDDGSHSDSAGAAVDEAEVATANDQRWQSIPPAFIGTDWRKHAHFPPKLQAVESVDDWITMFTIMCPRQWIEVLARLEPKPVSNIDLLKAMERLVRELMYNTRSSDAAPPAPPRRACSAQRF